MDRNLIYVVCFEWISGRTEEPVTTVEVAFHSLAQAQAYAEYATAEKHAVSRRHQLVGQLAEFPQFRYYVSTVELFVNRQQAE